jgi:hypothetical protein
LDWQELVLGNQVLLIFLNSRCQMGKKLNTPRARNPTAADLHSHVIDRAPLLAVDCWITVASPGANRTPTLFAAVALISSGVSSGLLTESHAGLLPTKSILLVTAMGTSKMV